MLHARVTPQTLGFVRAWVFGIWLWVVMGNPAFPDLGQLPGTLVKPVGVLVRIAFAVGKARVLSPPMLSGFRIVLIVVLALAMIGARPYRAIALLAVGMLTFHQGLVRGVGYIIHGTLPLLLITYILAVFPAADGFAWRSRGARVTSSPLYSAALVLMTLVLLLPYTLIAAYRVAHASPEIFLTDALLRYIAESIFPLTPYDGYGLVTMLGKRVLASPSLGMAAKLGFAVTTFFELLSPLCLLSRHFRYVWLAVIVSFHVGARLLLNIFFWHNLLLMAVLLIDLDYWGARVFALSSNETVPRAVFPLSAVGPARKRRSRSAGSFFMR
jgi:hypothetical protein